MGLVTSLAGCIAEGHRGGDSEDAGENHGTAPVIADGLAAYGRENGFVYGVDLVDLRARWQFDTGGLLPISISGEDGIVYAGNTDGEVYAIEMATGDQI